MWSRMKEAAQRSRIEARLKAILRDWGVADSASFSFSGSADSASEFRVAVVLGETAPMRIEVREGLERALNDAAGPTPVTLVETAHRPPSGVAGGSAKSGHTNPLGLTGRPGASSQQKARPGDARRVVAVASGKGGVGKTTVAAGLAVTLASRGQRVGLLDLDIYGPSLPIFFGIGEERPMVIDGRLQPLERAGVFLQSIGFLTDADKAVAWRGPMVMGAAKQLLAETDWPPLDWLLIDTPPGTGDAHLTLLQRAALDGAILVTTPSRLALADVRRGATLFRKMAVPVLGLVETMGPTADHPSPFGAGLTDHDLKALGTERLGAIPLESKVATLPDDPTKAASHEPFLALAETLSRLDRFENAG